MVSISALSRKVSTPLSISFIFNFSFDRFDAVEFLNWIDYKLLLRRGGCAWLAVAMTYLKYLISSLRDLFFSSFFDCTREYGIAEYSSSVVMYDFDNVPFCFFLLGPGCAVFIFLTAPSFDEIDLKLKLSWVVSYISPMIVAFLLFSYIGLCSCILFENLNPLRAKELTI